MTKEELVERVKGLLNADDDLSFLMKLGVEELKILVARIRERVSQLRRRGSENLTGLPMTL